MILIIKILYVSENKVTLMDIVTKYKIIKKYDDSPGWAIYLYTNTDGEGWNKAVYGSFMAKDPVNDLTFVFSDKFSAVHYAKGMFKSAEFID